MSASEYLRAASAKTQQISQLERDVQRPSIQQDFQQVATQSTAQAMVDQSPQASQLMLQKNRLDTSARSLQLKAMHAMMNGSAVQRIEDDEPLQSKFATTQLIEDDELLQGKFETVQRIEEDENALQGKFATIQRVDDEELLQGKFEITQRAEEDELLQGKFSTKQVQEQDPVKPNNTGLPNQLKAGIESLSGMSMDHVKVNYNSDKPAQLNAHAYAQGSEIHVAPGQEQHLPHEAWHVVQQAQGRVKPTMQMKQGVAVNDDVGLENEADVMGVRAMQASNQVSNASTTQMAQLFKQASSSVTNLVNETAQLTRFLTHDMNGFMKISGVSIFDIKQEVSHSVAFVVLQSGGPIYIATGEKGRHPALYQTARTLSGYQESEVRPSVYYAGSILPLDDGDYAWTNDSGHFLPTSLEAAQAGLPMEKFIPYEEYQVNGTERLRFGHIKNNKKSDDFVYKPGIKIDLDDSDDQRKPLIDEKEGNGCFPCVIM
jgi:hypothetical protein